METRVKQRVVGLVVLCALAVIFIPLLFKRTPTLASLEAVNSSMPATPDKPTPQAVITMQSDTLPPVNSATATPNNSATGVADKGATSLAATEPQRPVANTVFSSEQNQLTAPDERLSKSAPAASHSTSIPTGANKLAFGNASISPVQAEQQQEVQAQKATEVVQDTDASRVPAPVKKPHTPASSADNIAPVPKNNDIVSEKSKLVAKSAVAPQPVDDKGKKAEIIAATKTSLAQELADMPATINATAKKATTSNNIAALPSASAWVVQLGSFSNPAHAKELIDKLRAKGFTAYSHEFKTAKGATMTRVVVGPNTQRTQADTLQATLNKDMHLKGVVVAFDPLAVK